MAFEAQGNINLSAGQVTRLLELSPRMAPAHGLYGRLLAHQNQLEKAEEELHKALTLDPFLVRAGSS